MKKRLNQAINLALLFSTGVQAMSLQKFDQYIAQYSPGNPATIDALLAAFDQLAPNVPQRTAEQALKLRKNVTIAELRAQRAAATRRPAPQPVKPTPVQPAVRPVPKPVPGANQAALQQLKAAQQKLAQQRLAAQKQIAAQKKKLTAQQQQLLQQLQQIVQLVSTVQKTQAQMQALAQQLGVQQTQAQQAQQAAQQTIATLKQQLAQAKDSQKSDKNLSAALIAAQSALANATTQLQQLTQANQQLNALIGALNTQITTAQQRITKLKGDKTTSAAALAALNQQLAQSKQAATALQQLVTQNNTTIAALNSQVAALQAQLNQSKTDYDDTQNTSKPSDAINNKIEGLDSTAQEVKNDINTASNLDDANKLKAELDKANSAIETIERVKTESESDINTAKNSNELNAQEADELTTKLNGLDLPKEDAVKPILQKIATIALDEVTKLNADLTNATAELNAAIAGNDAAAIQQAIQKVQNAYGLVQTALNNPELKDVLDQLKKLDAADPLVQRAETTQAAVTDPATDIQSAEDRIAEINTPITPPDGGDTGTGDTGTGDGGGPVGDASQDVKTWSTIDTTAISQPEIDAIVNTIKGAGFIINDPKATIDKLDQATDKLEEALFNFSFIFTELKDAAAENKLRPLIKEVRARYIANGGSDGLLIANTANKI